MKIKPFILGYGFGILTLIACATSTPYRYYGLSIPDDCYDKGTLLGHQGSDGWADLPFDECKPDQAIKGKCVIMRDADWFAKDKDLKDCQTALISCQKGPAPTSTP